MKLVVVMGHRRCGAVEASVLFLPPLAQGREIVSEKSLRRIVGECHWKRQRERFPQPQGTDALAQIRPRISHRRGSASRVAARSDDRPRRPIRQRGIRV